MRRAAGCRGRGQGRRAGETLLRAHALHALSDADTAFAIEVLRKLPAQVVRENWPYGVIL